MDELVKALREAHEHAMEWERNPFRYAALYKKAADAIEELSAIREEQKAQIVLMAAEDKTRWIPVTETPPRKVGDNGYTGYLVYANGYYEVADYTTDKFDNVPYFYVDGEHEPNVTHYMPLPEPPKEEAQ